MTEYVNNATSKSDKPKVFLADDPKSLDVIPPLENRLEEMKKFIHNIRDIDLRLKRFRKFQEKDVGGKQTTAIEYQPI